MSVVIIGTSYGCDCAIMFRKLAHTFLFVQDFVSMVLCLLSIAVTSKAPIPVPKQVRPVIEAWRRLCKDSAPDALMFPTFGRGDRKGQAVPRWEKNFLTWRIRPIARKLGIPDRLVTFQVMRRTLGTGHAKSRNSEGHPMHVAAREYSNHRRCLHTEDRRKCRWGSELADRRSARRTARFTGEAEAEGKES
jgi:hypothetical protein